MSQNALGTGAGENAAAQGSVRGRWGLSGSTLKLIAIAAMFIDHVGAAVLARLLVSYYWLEEIITHREFLQYFPWIGDINRLHAVYANMRSIGRLAFPIYCFLLVEGFQKTRNMKKYLLRLGAFCLISEIPFDLAFHAAVWDMSGQNVFFTLFIGLLAMIGCDRAVRRKRGFPLAVDVSLRFALAALCVGMGAYAAEMLHTDYGARGVFCIMALYFFRRHRLAQVAAGALSFLWEIPAPLAFLPVAAYNGRRGLRVKYVFYIFYPLHLLLLYLLCAWLGIGNIAAF